MKRAFAAVATVLGSIAAGIALDRLVFERRLARWRNGPMRARLRTEQSTMPGSSDDLLVVGDRLVADGDWSGLLPDRSVRLRGIPGDTTSDVLDRLNEVLDPPPAAVMVQVGTNDLARGVAHAQVVRNYQEILDQLRAALPDAPVIAVTVPPRNDRFNSVVGKLNGAIARLCEQRGLALLDLHAAVADERGRLADSLTHDGTHLLDEGYRRWANALQELLDRPA